MSRIVTRQEETCRGKVSDSLFVRYALCSKGGSYFFTGA
jgi:hypothetical protein